MAIALTATAIPIRAIPIRAIPLRPMAMAILLRPMATAIPLRPMATVIQPMDIPIRATATTLTTTACDGITTMAWFITLGSAEI